MDIKDSNTQGKMVDIECPQCGLQLEHTIERAVDWSAEDEHYSVWGTAQIVRCNGCHTFSFRHLVTDSETVTRDDQGNMEYAESLYPRRISPTLANTLFLRDDIYDIPEMVRTIYREALGAVQHRLPTIAGVAIRAIIEAICKDLGVSRGNLEKKIDKLFENKYLTSSGVAILHGLRLLGNDAAHEMKAPTDKQIAAALKAIDHLLLGVYILPEEASVFKKTKKVSAKKAAKK